MVIAVLAFLWFRGLAQAQNPHFISASDSLANQDEPAPADLRASWKEAGLGNNQQVDYTLSADGTATYACINKGGSHPQASNKTNVSGPVSASGTFSSGKNGAITASLTADEPESTDFCPSGQSFVLASVSFNNVVLEDTTNGFSEDLAPASKVFCDLDNLSKATVKNCVAITE